MSKNNYLGEGNFYDTCAKICKYTASFFVFEIALGGKADISLLAMPLYFASASLRQVSNSVEKSKLVKLIK